MTSDQNQESTIQHPPSRIDAHQHFWNYDPRRDGWITDEMKTLQQAFRPDDLVPVLNQNKIDGCITVQADQSEQETEFLLALAHQHSFIKGVVGWVDLCSEAVSDRLDHFSRFKLLKGFRHILQSAPVGFMNRMDFRNGISQLQKYNFAYDILIYYYQLGEAIELVKLFPNQRFVIDHLAKPGIKEKEFESWAGGMKQLASFDNVSCKVSGFTTEAGWKTWTTDDFTPYFDFVLQHFGATRLMYGSDWPVCLLASTYERQLNLVEDFISKLSPSEKLQVMGGNAIDFYNL